MNDRKKHAADIVKGVRQKPWSPREESPRAIKIPLPLNKKSPSGIRMPLPSKPPPQRKPSKIKPYEQANPKKKK